jgi:hypothetical protein
MRKYLKSFFVTPVIPVPPDDMPSSFIFQSLLYEPEHIETIFIEPRASRATIQLRFDTRPPEIRRKVSLTTPVLEKQGYVKVSSMLQAESKYRYLLYRDGYLFIYKRKPVIFDMCHSAN